MEILAPASFATACFAWAGPRPSLTVMAKQTFRLAAPRLEVLEDANQLIRGADDAWGAPRYPDDFVPWKGAPELFVVGHAKASIPQRDISVGVELGGWSKRCRAVAGVPSYMIPLGPAYLRDDDGDTVWLGPTSVDPVWNERELAAGFDYHRFNRAPEDQHLPRVEPGASLVLRGLDRTSPLRTRLADWRPSAALRLAGGDTLPLPMRCDTLWIDVDAHVVVGVWRGMWAAERDQRPTALFIDGDDAPIEPHEVADRRESARRRQIRASSAATMRSKEGIGVSSPALHIQVEEASLGRGTMEMTEEDADRMRPALPFIQDAQRPLEERVQAGRPSDVALSSDADAPISIADPETLALHSAPPPTVARPEPPPRGRRRGSEDAPIDDAPTREDRNLLPPHLRDALRRAREAEADGAATLEVEVLDPTIEEPIRTRGALPEHLVAILDEQADSSDGRETIPREDPGGLEDPTTEQHMPVDTGSTPVVGPEVDD